MNEISVFRSWASAITAGRRGCMSPVEQAMEAIRIFILSEPCASDRQRA